MGGGKVAKRAGTFSIAVITGILLVFFPYAYSPDLAVASTVNVEVGSPVYGDIEFLSAVGLLDTAMIGTLPLSREEVARLVVEARIKAGIEGSLSKRKARILKRMEEEFSEDIDDLKTGNDTVYFKPVREAGGHYLYLDQPESAHPGPNTDAVQRAFTYNREGVDYQKNNGVAYFNSDGRIKLFSYFLKPFLTYRKDSSGDTNFTLHKGYVKFGSRIELELGQDSKWWGQGRHGSLLLSNNAEPLLMINLRNTRPFILPLVGLMKFDIFLSQLENERDFKRPNLYGARVSLKPSPLVEIGIQKAAIFGGSGRPSLDFGDIMRVLFAGSSEEPDGDTSNQIIGIDFRVRIPSFNADIYVEAGAEDFRDYYPYKYAFIFGAYVADIGGFSVRSEFFDSNRNHGVWYRNGTYTSGYTFKNRVLGHHAGGDAEDLFIELSRELSDNIMVTGSFDLEKRGFNLAKLETHYQYQAKVRLRLYPYLAEVTGGWEQVKNPGFAPGEREDNYVGIISVKRYF